MFPPRPMTTPWKSRTQLHQLSANNLRWYETIFLRATIFSPHWSYEQVSVEFVDLEKRPGEKTKIVMKAKPGSRVAISALDKGVLLLKNANEIKKSDVSIPEINTWTTICLLHRKQNIWCAEVRGCSTRVM